MKLNLDRMGARASDLIIRKPNPEKEPAKVTQQDSEGEANG